MVYNITWMDTSNTFYDIVSGVNGSLANFFGTILLVGIFLILLMVFSARYEFKKVFFAVSWFTVMIGGLFWWINLIPLTHLVTIIFIMVISIVMIMKD